MIRVGENQVNFMTRLIHEFSIILENNFGDGDQTENKFANFTEYDQPKGITLLKNEKF